MFSCLLQRNALRSNVWVRSMKEKSIPANANRVSLKRGAYRNRKSHPRRYIYAPPPPTHTHTTRARARTPRIIFHESWYLHMLVCMCIPSHNYRKWYEDGTSVNSTTTRSENRLPAGKEKNHLHSSRRLRQAYVYHAARISCGSLINRSADDDESTGQINIFFEANDTCDTLARA